MKLADITKVMAKELGSSDLNEINKLLKKEPQVKFRVAGKSPLGFFGFTGFIKALTEDGVKAFMSGKVSLIRLEHIETFEKAFVRPESSAKPVTAVQPKKPSSPAPAAKLLKEKTKAPVKPKFIDDDDFDDDDLDGPDVLSDEEIAPKKIKKNKSRGTGKSGSRFIPKFKK